MSVVLAHRIESWEINPQDDSPLFNGKIPAEIRLEIFRLALNPRMVPWDRSYHSHTGTQTAVQHSGAADDLTSNMEKCATWSHSGRYCCRPVLSLGLIGTCRRALAEARAFVHTESERHIWEGILMPIGRLHGTVGGAGHKRWLSPRRKWERLFKRVHIVGPPRPERDFFRHVGKWWRYDALPPYARVEHLRLTVPDHVPVSVSWGEESTLQMNPFGPPEDMEAAMEATADFDLAAALAAARRGCRDEGGGGSGRPAWMPPGVSYWHHPFLSPGSCWGRGFVNTPRLRTFTLTIEAREERRERVERIMQWAARAWQFPLNPNTSGGWHYLSPDGAIERTVTAGRACQCVTFLSQSDEEYAQRLSSTMHYWTLRWTRRKYEGPEVYPYHGAVAVVEGVDLLDADACDSDIEW